MNAFPQITYQNDAEVINAIKGIEEQLLSINEDLVGAADNSYAFLSALGGIITAERNVDCGLSMAAFDLRPTHLRTDIFDDCARLKSILERKRDAINKQPVHNHQTAAEKLLAFAYGFSPSGDTVGELQTAVKNRIAQKEYDQEYLRGCLYYFHAAKAASSGRGFFPLSPRVYGLAYSHPLVSLFKFDYTLRKKNRIYLTLIDDSEDIYLDGHTRRRIYFINALYFFYHNQGMSDDILLGFRTGIQADADLATAAILRAGRRYTPSAEGSEAPINACKTTAVFGYRAASYLALHLRGNSDANDKSDLYELFVCAVDNDEYKVRYLNAHDQMKGNEADLIKKVSDTTKIKMFHDIKGKPELFETAAETAELLWQEDADMALWLGNVYFSKGQYSEALDVFRYTCDRYRDSEAAKRTAKCYLHGYGAPADYTLAGRYLSRADDSPLSDIEKTLFRLYGIGDSLKEMNVNHITQKHPTAEWIGILAHAANENLAMLKIWQKFWDWHENDCGMTFSNQAQRNTCFRPFVELISVDYMLKLTYKRGKALSRYAVFKAGLKERGDFISKMLFRYFIAIESFSAAEPIPTRGERFLSFFSKGKHDMMLLKISYCLERRLETMMTILDEIYEKDRDAFARFHYIPWMDEVCKALEGRLLYRKAASSDVWTSRGLYRQSAEKGDGKAAFRIYMSSEFTVKDKDAFRFLDRAINCNHPHSLYENSYLIENGFRDGDLTEAHNKSIWKGDILALTNALTYYHYRSYSWHRKQVIKKVGELKNVELPPL